MGMDGLRPKGHAGTADYPGQNILEIKNSGRRPHLVGIGKEEEEDNANNSIPGGRRKTTGKHDPGVSLVCSV